MTVAVKAIADLVEPFERLGLAADIEGVREIEDVEEQEGIRERSMFLDGCD